MKKLDKLILGAFYGPFFITFFVVVFIFLTQYLLKYLNEIVGKGLGFGVYAELIFYFSINMMPVALPLGVLLSCLMTYGNLGEHFELTALKGSGVSLTRVLVPVGLVAFFLSVGSFYFSNDVVPKTNLKAYSLLYDIRQKKPSLDIREGAFYDGLPGYSVKVRKKFEDGKTLKGVMIYNHSGNQGNTEVILADSGYMYTFSNEEYLALELYNGNSYTEYIDGGNALAPEEFVRNSFKKSKLVFSLASFGLNHTPSDLFAGNKIMKSVAELDLDIDSMKREKKKITESLLKNIRGFYSFNVIDTAPPKAVAAAPLPDTAYSAVVLNRASTNVRGIKSFVGGTQERFDFTQKQIKQFQAEKTKKYTQACACFIMFLIGAPLGAIIKKGGLGVPVIISIIFFIIYYVVTMLGEKWAKEGLMVFETGMWLGNLILLPIGLFFLRQAKKDSRILETDFYIALFNKMKDFIVERIRNKKGDKLVNN